jgi:ribulose-5-phosphate 4-epimerase/fuculose-1-phosphate aldolase
MHADEGVIKFSAEHRYVGLDSARYGDPVADLIAWRTIFAHTGVIGQEQGRYGGAGFGNVSARTGAPSSPTRARAFVVSGTQTSGLACVTLEQFALVERYDFEQNRVVSQGLIEPSSESMTHGAIYDCSPHIRVVLHGHSPLIWRHAKALRLPITDPAIAYGTPQMAYAVQDLYRRTALSEQRIFSMGGHEDGIVVFGRSAEDAGQVFVTYLARAYRHSPGC